MIKYDTIYTDNDKIYTKKMKCIPILIKNIPL